jgi:uncharacterized repeat protein (TIGR01451 family)
MHSYRKTHRSLSLILIFFTIMASSAAALAQGSSARFTARALNPARATDLKTIKEDVRPNTAAIGKNNLVSVIVKLDVAPLATYTGNVAGLRATSPQVTGARHLDVRSTDSQRYLAYLNQRESAFEKAAFASIPQARITGRYHNVFGGVAMVLPENQVSQVARLPGVVSVQRGHLYQPTTDNSPSFIGATAIWSALGGQESAGENIVVGVVDTGIWPEHPSFSDPDPSGKPYPAPIGWSGTCEAPHDASPAIVCNNKLIGAREHLDTYKALIGLVPGEYDSARDNEGHGTHTTSTAAGNANVTATIFGVNRGHISGIAPRAHVAAYKALGEQGGFDADLVEAIDQAVADGVNVINYSIGQAGGGTPPSDPTEQAFLDAYAAGVFVAASAGNSGPGPGTVDHIAGWITTVAASTQNRAFDSTLTLQASGGATLTLHGASITAGVSSFTPVVMPADTLCLSPFPAGSVTGKIVACQRGVNARVDKGFNVKQGGAVGMILYNAALADTETDNHWLPTVHLPDGTSFVAFMGSHTGVMAKFTQGMPTAAQGDVMAAFSSRGPSADGAFIKPDITAPGVQVLAGHTPTPIGITNGPAGELFQAIAGTSMSSPHIAGSGALLKALHPDWTPGQIKSALMTSAKTSVVKEDQTTPADAFDDGSGRVDLTKAGNPGLTFDVTAAQYAGQLASGSSAWDLNYPSIYVNPMPGRITLTRTAHSELNEKSKWTFKTKAPSGVTITVNPKELTMAAHGFGSFTVTIEAANVPDGTYFGSVELSYKKIKVNMPVAFERRQTGVTLAKTCAPATINRGEQSTCTIAADNTTDAPAVVSVKDVVPKGLDIVPGSVMGATQSGSTLTFNGTLPVPSGTVDVVADPGGSPAGYLPLAALGVPPLTGVCSDCDEASVSFDVDPFTYGGRTYSTVTMVTDGYLIAGDDTTVDFINQHLPDPNLPNNVIAPYWADLDLNGDLPSDGGNGTWSAALVTDGVNNFFVGEWTGAGEFGVSSAAHTFQVWIQLGTDNIWMTYGPTSATAPALTVGAENFNGMAGDNYYVDTTSTGINGTGTVPVPGDELKVNTTAIPATHTITFKVKGSKKGTFVNTAEMTSNRFAGTALSSATIKVK